MIFTFLFSYGSCPRPRSRTKRSARTQTKIICCFWLLQTGPPVQLSPLSPKYQAGQWQDVNFYVTDTDGQTCIKLKLVQMNCSVSESKPIESLRRNKDDKETSLDVKICFVQFSTQRLNELKEATRLDPYFNILMKYIYIQWISRQATRFTLSC